MYIAGGYENLYEKYGFDIIDHKIAPWGAEENIYAKAEQNIKEKERSENENHIKGWLRKGICGEQKRI